MLLNYIIIRTIFINVNIKYKINLYLGIFFYAYRKIRLKKNVRHGTSPFTLYI